MARCDAKDKGGADGGGREPAAAEAGAEQGCGHQVQEQEEGQDHQPHEGGDTAN